MGRPSKVPINRIDLGDSPHPRVEIDHGVVEDYVERLQAGERFPPVTLFLDGERYLIGDGWHRITAAIRSSGQEADSLSDDVVIEATIHKGTLRGCMLYAVGANADHGLRRTREDKRKAVALLLNDAEWNMNSDNWIAEQCKVSDHLVASVRNEFNFENSKLTESPKVEPTVKRTGKDGRTRNVTKIGKRAKKAPDVKGAVKADPPPPVQSEPAKEPGGDPRHEVREAFAEGTQSIINKLPGCPQEPAKAAVRRDPVPHPCPVSSDTEDPPCKHVEVMFAMGFAYRLRGKATLLVRDHNRNGSERELNFCPVCGVPVQTDVTEERQHGYGDVGAAASAPMTA